ncbi:MAG TPA: HepT-like ribonuclease domain-containing protein [Roseiarcus sp.]|nr:HepT-like ribonuclease domain-containing protein [Roseiarcus sp.]
MLSEIEKDAPEDIRDNIARAMRFVIGLDLDGFLKDDKTFYAATRCLEIISEASRRLSPAFKERHPEIPWRAVAGSGSIYRHNDADVLKRRIWQTIHEALPPLRAIVDVELRE